MKFFWSLRDIPELANLKTAQQQLAFRECYQKYLFTLWQTWIACAVMSLSVMVGMHLLGPIVGGVVGGAIGGLLLSAIITNALRPKLKAYVNHHFQEQII